MRRRAQEGQTYGEIEMRACCKPNLGLAPPCRLHMHYCIAIPLEMLPVVALDEPQLAALQIRDACESHGAFFVAQHGISQAVVDEAFRAAECFYAQPLSAKQAVKVTAQGSQARVSRVSQVAPCR